MSRINLFHFGSVTCFVNLFVNLAVTQWGTGSQGLCRCLWLVVLICLCAQNHAETNAVDAPLATGSRDVLEAGPAVCGFVVIRLVAIGVMIAGGLSSAESLVGIRAVAAALGSL